MFIVFFRVILLYILIIASLRLMGKRQIAQLQPTELVITILISNIATMAIEDPNVPFVNGILPILTLISFDVVVSAIMLRHKKLRQIVSGTPRYVIKDGVIDQDQLRELRYSIDDVIELLRAKDIFDIQDVAFAVVETTGEMNIYPKFEAQPVTAGMLNLPGSESRRVPPVVVISDGTIIDDALLYCNVEKRWIKQVVQENHYALKDVFLMTCNRQRDYHIVPKQTKTSNGKEASA